MAYAYSLLLCVQVYCFVTVFLWFPISFTDAGITWNQPSSYSPSGTSDVRTTTQSFLNGSAVQRLIWDFTLSGETLDRIFWEREKDGVRIGLKKASGVITRNDEENFLEHFNISSSDPATLIIYDVTEADEGLEISCKVETGVKVWKDIVKVRIVVKPKLIDVSGSQTVCKGDNVILLCNATGKPDLSVNWTRILKDGSDSEILHTGEEWVLTNINKSAEGTYRCTASVGVGNYSVNHTMDVTVNFSPLIGPLSNLTVHEEDNVSLSCNVSAIPSASIRWISPSGDVLEEARSTTLVQILKSQSGEYICEASNRCGNVSEGVFITVQYKPENVELQITPPDEVCKDGMITLNCSADAVPAVHTYQLFQNDILLENSSSGNFSRNMSMEGNFMLKCAAINTVGSANSSSHALVVNVPSKVASLASVTYEEGESFNVTCMVTGSPAPDVVWVDVRTNNRTYGNVLNFTSVARTQNGEYRCESTNECGNDSESVFVIVHYPPSILTTSVNQTVNESDTVTLNCTADSKPPANITWTRVSDSSSVSFPLTITGKQDEGFYRCTASNGVGSPATKDVFIAVENFHPFGTQVMTTLQNSATVVNDTFNVTCTAVANPPAEYMIYKDGIYLINITSHPAVLETSVTEIVDQARYKCVPFNSFGPGPEKEITIAVHYPPSILTTSVNQTVNESDTVTLNCTADSNPPANLTWIRLFDNSFVSFPLTITGKQDEGFYRCIASNGVGRPATKDVFIAVENFHPFGTQVMTTLQNNATVVNNTFNVTCTAVANPPAEYMIYKDDISLINITSHPAVHETSATERVNQTRYKCVPFNSFGPGPEKEITIAVHYKPDNVSLVSNVSGNKVCLGDTVSFTCTADANPDVNRYLLRENQPMIESNSGKWLQTLSTSSHYNFSCMVNNSVGKKQSSFVTITVNVPPSTDSLANITVVEGSNLTLTCNSSGIPAPSVKWIRVSSGKEENGTTWIITNISRDYDGDYKCEATNECKTSTTITDVTVHYPPNIIEPQKATYESSPDTNVEIHCNATGNPKPSVSWTNANGEKTGSGGILRFSSIKESDNGSVYICTAENGVEPADSRSISLIAGVHPTESTTQGNTPELELWHFIVIGVGALVVLILIVVIVACWFNKKRKCIKTRVHNNEDATADQQPLQELRRSGTEENAYDRVNHGYSESGPTPNSENAQGAASAADVPAYAVVDKSQKKGKKEKQEEIAPDSQNVTYAVVDKSTKKKKKNEKPEDMYAQVDRSKKSKRSKDPGDVLYADLGAFHARGNMPQAATSPEPLPPIKMPTAYEKTEYADITQFLKGDATLPQSVDTSQAAKADQGQSHPPMDGTQAAGGATGANNVSKL